MAKPRVVDWQSNRQTQPRWVVGWLGLGQPAACVYQRLLSWMGRLHRLRWSVWGGILLGMVSGLTVIGLHPTQASTRPVMTLAQSTPPVTLEQGQALYTAGQLVEAATVLEQVVESTPDLTQQVVALRNLALVYQQLGQWTAAAAAIAQAQARLQTQVLPNQRLLLAQLLEVQGGIQLDQGQGEAAIATWQRVIDLYDQIDLPEARFKALVNQAQALQTLGFHRQVIRILQPLVDGFDAQSVTVTQAIALQILGDSRLEIGNLEAAETTLLSSQRLAETLASPATLRVIALSLGNLKAAQADTAAALAYYRQAAAGDSLSLVQVQAQLNWLSLLVTTAQFSQAQALWPSILPQLAALSPSRATLLAQINLAQTLIQLPDGSASSPAQIAELLAGAVEQARSLGDRRSESFAIGTLGHLYETLGQWADAANLSQAALTLAQSLDAADITYRWQWQLGRIYQAEQKIQPAIAAYTGAVKTLQRLRQDLVAVNPSAQVSFQENVEPLHRALVSLLLAPERDPTSEELETARETLESLQLAELDNFFREACLETAAVEIDQLDQTAAVVYPIILADRLEIIVSLPNQALRRYTSPVEIDDLRAVLEQLQQLLVLRIGRGYLPFSQQLYGWMMRPLRADLAASQVTTLVFVLDGELRNIPMAALHDGNQFLLEQYNIAYTPGLQLVNPRPIQSQDLRVVTAGLSEARQGFSALPNVVEEVQQIQATVPAAVLLNDGFTLAALENSLNLEGAPIVHLASHGQFSSSSGETFVLTWDNRLDIPTLNNLLQTSELNQAGPIELLVLSACQTATGDKQAALGLAGMAVRSGARSTIATLWQVSDLATALLMAELYQNLTNPGMTKADALRQAQLKVLREPQFRQHPFYWAPYVLVGNWL